MTDFRSASSCVEATKFYFQRALRSFTYNNNNKEKKNTDIVNAIRNNTNSILRIIFIFFLIFSAEIPLSRDFSIEISLSKINNRFPLASQKKHNDGSEAAAGWECINGGARKNSTAPKYTRRQRPRYAFSIVRHRGPPLSDMWTRGRTTRNRSALFSVTPPPPPVFIRPTGAAIVFHGFRARWGTGKFCVRTGRGRRCTARRPVLRALPDPTAGMMCMVFDAHRRVTNVIERRRPVVVVVAVDESPTRDNNNYYYRNRRRPPSDNNNNNNKSFRRTATVPCTRGPIRRRCLEESAGRRRSNTRRQSVKQRRFLFFFYFIHSLCVPNAVAVNTRPRIFFTINLRAFRLRRVLSQHYPHPPFRRVTSSARHAVSSYLPIPAAIRIPCSVRIIFEDERTREPPPPFCRKAMFFFSLRHPGPPFTTPTARTTLNRRKSRQPRRCFVSRRPTIIIFIIL